MRCSFLTFVLAAVSTVATPALARPFEAELVARSPEPAKKLTFVPPPPSKGGKGGDAQSGNSGIVDGGSVYQLTNSSGKVSNSFGSAQAGSGGESGTGNSRAGDGGKASGFGGLGGTGGFATSGSSGSAYGGEVVNKGSSISNVVASSKGGDGGYSHTGNAVAGDGGSA